jgi:prepilin-type N-terminal cleavage/methylation domain-containing protein
MNCLRKNTLSYRRCDNERMAVNGPARRFPPTRTGFSLVEILLVMAILVLVGALSVPAVQQSFSRQSLGKAADRMRVAMGQARVKAIREGEVYAVFFSEGGSWFNVAPFSKAEEQSGLASDRQRLADNNQHSNFEEDLLPKGIRFSAGVVPIDSRAAQTLGTDNSTQSIRPILFYPDGTSQDARIVMENEKQNYVEIQLRGLTGLATVIRLKEQPNIQ